MQMNNGEYIHLDFSMDDPVLFALRYAFLSIKDINQLIEDYRSELWWYSSSSYTDKIYERISFLKDVKKEIWIRGYALKDMTKGDYPYAYQFCHLYNGDLTTDRSKHCMDDHVISYSAYHDDYQCGGMVECCVPRYERYESIADLPDDKVYIDDSVFAEAKRRIIISDVNSLLKKAMIRHAKYLSLHKDDKEDVVNPLPNEVECEEPFKPIRFIKPSTTKTVTEKKQAPVKRIKPKSGDYTYTPYPNKPIVHNKRLSFEEKVVNILRQHDGIKAIEIAVKLKCSRKEINHLLYGSLKDKVYCDSSYKWHIKPW